MALEREVGLSRLLVAYFSSGIAFMLLPGTFLGVWNLISISNQKAAASVAPAWLQAHGQAQVFGWIGSFILGIGFYSIPKLLRASGFALWRGWTCWALWTTGVGLRWIGNVYEWHWQVLLPVSAALELFAFFLFFQAVLGHRTPGRKKSFDGWVVVVVLGTIGLSATLLLNLGAAVYLALGSISPAFPTELDQRFLMLTAWGFIVPFVWGFSARWMLIFLGLPALRKGMLLTAAGVNATGVALAVAGLLRIAAVVILGSAVLGVASLRMFEPAKQSQNAGGAQDIPLFRARCLCLAAGSGGVGGLGRICARRNGRDLGRIAPRTHRGVHSCHGLRGGTTGAAGFFRHAASLQPALDVFLTGPVDRRLHDARRVRNSCVPAVPAQRMVVAAVFGNDRVDRGDAICD
jgi:hypothetical protein